MSLEHIQLARALAEFSSDPAARIVCLLFNEPDQTSTVDTMLRWFGGKNPERVKTHLVKLRSWGVVQMSTASTGNQFVRLANLNLLPRLHPLPSEIDLQMEYPLDLAVAGRKEKDIAPRAGQSPADAVNSAPEAGRLRTHAEQLPTVHLASEIYKSQLPGETHAGAIIDWLEIKTPVDSWREWGGWWRVVARNNPDRVELAYRKLQLAGEVKHPARFMRARIMEMAEGCG